MSESELKGYERTARAKGMTLSAWARQTLRAGRQNEPGSSPEKKLMAIRAAAWVVPVSLAGTQRLMRKGDWTIHPGEVVVRYGPPILAAEYAEDQRDELRRRAQEMVAAGLPEEQKPSAGN